MIARQLEGWLRSVAERPQVVHLVGLRQTGKTTLMNAFRQKYPGALYYPLFDLVTLRRYEAEPEKWVLELEDVWKKERGRLSIFVDEIQKIPAFFQAIQGLYERYKGRMKFWIWGSSARALKRRRAETLAGRSLSKILGPLSQAEIRNRESCVPFLLEPEELIRRLDPEEPRDYARSFERWMQQTMLPEPCLLEDLSSAHDLLQAYQATYLENEIRRENLVQDIGLFERFLALAASEDTQITSDAAKAKVLGVSPHTVKAYYGVLEDTFVCRRLDVTSKSLRVQISKSPKIYFSDTGLARFVSGERGLPNEHSSQFGALVEGFVVNEIFKQIEYHSLPWRLSYLRTRTGMEVDLIITSGRQSVAIEIKAARKLASGDFRSLLSLMEMDPQVRHGIVFSRQSAPFQLHPNIFNVPIWNL